MSGNVVQFPPLKTPRKIDREHVKLFGGMALAVIAAAILGSAALFIVTGLLMVISAVVNLTYRDTLKSEE